MKSRINLLLMPALALTMIGATMAMQAGRGASGAAQRAEGPCDIYAAAGTPCVAAHSDTRALCASYGGPLYQVKRLSDGKTLDVGVDAGGYAEAETTMELSFGLGTHSSTWIPTGRQPWARAAHAQAARLCNSRRRRVIGCTATR